MAQKQSILGRIGQLTRANINSLLDKAEDPQKMLDQLVRGPEIRRRVAGSGHDRILVHQVEDVRASPHDTEHQDRGEQ